MPVSLLARLRGFDRLPTLRATLLLIIPALLACLAFAFYLFSGRYVSTDNAYIGAEKVLITPEVSGKVVRISVVEGQLLKPGDELLIYHTGDVKAVVGRGKVVAAAYADPTDKAAKFVAVDVAPGKPLARPVPLREIKGEKVFKEWGLVKIGRLSVVPTTKSQFDRVLQMAGS